MLAEFSIFAPELLVAVTILLLLCYGVFKTTDLKRDIHYFAVFGLCAALLCLILIDFDEQGIFIYSVLVKNEFVRFVQATLVAGSIAYLLLLSRSAVNNVYCEAESPVIVLLSVLGMMVAVSANDLLVLYLALELMALPLYIMVAMRKNVAITSEAAIKYFILGAFSSAIMLFGMSFVFGFAGTTEYNALSIIVSGLSMSDFAVTGGLAFILAGFAFKLSMVPFHMWTPDVYEGSPTIVTTLIASLPKFAAFAALANFLHGPMSGFYDTWSQFIYVLCVMSMTLGVFVALFQNNIYRLLAYSTIANMGYVMLGLLNGQQQGFEYSLVYMTIYLLMSLSIFTCLLSLKRQNQLIENIADLRGLGQINPGLSLVMAISLFSLAGIPPFAGFLGKLVVFKAALDAGFYYTVIIAVLTTVVGAAYYLWVVKTMYFDSPAGGEATVAFDKVVGFETKAILIILTLFNIFFIFLPQWLFNLAERASHSIFVD